MVVSPLFLVPALIGQYAVGSYSVAVPTCQVGTYATSYSYTPYATAVVVADPAYYTSVVADYVRKQATADAAAAAQKDLTVRLDQLAEVVKDLNTKVAAASASAATVAATTMPHAPTSTSPVADLLQRNRCAKCHTGPSGAGGVTLFESPGKLANLDDGMLTAIGESVLGRKMPPKKEGFRVPAADLKAFAALLPEEPAQ